MLIGGLWVYSEPLDRTGPQDPFAGPVSRTSAERSALGRRNDAQASLRRARRAQEQARRNLELRREAYRTELDAGRSGAEAEPAFRRAERAFTAAERRTRRSGAAVASTRPAAVRAQRSIEVRQRAADRRSEDALNDRERNTFLLRLAWVIAVMAAGFLLLARLRRRRSRYLTVGLAFVGFATAQALVMAVDYPSDYIDLDEIGPAVLSADGGTPALPRKEAPGPPCEEARVPGLRVSRLGQSLLRGLWSRGARRVRDLWPRAPRRHRAVRRVRRRLTYSSAA